MLRRRIYGNSIRLRKALVASLPAMSSMMPPLSHNVAYSLYKIKEITSNNMKNISFGSQPLHNVINRIKLNIYNYTSVLWRGNYINDDTWELYINKRIVLLYGAMVRKRHFRFTFPVNGTVAYSLSDLSGHSSFIFLSLSYLESDFLNLRIYAMSGLALSIIFQYYRERPLWIPIRWNTLFLLINAIMILLIMKENHDALNLPEEQKDIYERLFKSHGMKLVDFLHLMSIAERHVIKRNEKLISLGSKHNHLHFVQCGKLSVRNKAGAMSSIHENQFVGVLSFLAWDDNLKMQNQIKQSKQEEYEMWNSDSILSLTNDSFITAAMVNTSTHAEESADESAIDESSGSGQADVICEEDGVVYSWDFKELRELLLTSPGLNLVFEHCISRDLNQKISTYSTQQQHHYSEQYADLVRIVLSRKQRSSPRAHQHSSSPSSSSSAKEGGDVYVTENDRQLLTAFRQEFNISEKDHLQAIETAGWTSQQFEVGTKSQLTQQILNQYYALVETEIKNKKHIKHQQKTKFASFRSAEGINLDHHAKALQLAGWSFDEYDEGKKKI